MNRMDAPKTFSNPQARSARVQSALAEFIGLSSSPPRWEGKKTFIYGAGNFGQRVAKALLNHKITVLGFLDQRGTGQIVFGPLRAYSPSSLEAKRWLAEKPVALIGTHNPVVSLREIAGLLSGIGFAQVVTPMEIYLHLGRELGWFYWLGTKEDYASAAERIEKACAIWADAESERLFLQTLLFRLQFDLEGAMTISGASCQYAHPTVPRWKEPLRMVDGGKRTPATPCAACWATDTVLRRFMLLSRIWGISENFGILSGRCREKQRFSCGHAESRRKQID